MDTFLYCYADDVKDYWNTFDKRVDLTDYDPDTKSLKLMHHLYELYKEDKGNGCFLQGLIESNENDLYIETVDIHLGCDSIANLLNIDALLIDNNSRRTYCTLANTLGAKIIFPKNGKGCFSINNARNCKVVDRFDYTLECIRRYYNGEESRLNDVFLLEKNKKFFNLFRNKDNDSGKDAFKNYVNFFFLNDLVSDDFEKVKFFINTDEDTENRQKLINFENSISKYPYKIEDWRELYKETMLFVIKRNLRIYNCINKSGNA